MNDECASFSVIDPASCAEAKLAMQSLWLTGRILPVGARLVVVHTFRSAESKPIEVVYAFGLPRDAALRRFKIVGAGFQMRSELKPVGKAVKAYEGGLQAGHLSSLARVYRDGRVNLSVGNLRPGEEVKVFLELVAGVDLRPRGLRFRFPFTLAPCYHAQARAAETAPGVGELELPEDAFGDLLLPRYLAEASSLHQVGFDLSVGFPGPVREVSSPSHGLSVSGADSGQVRIGLARESDLPNRDLVLDLRSSEPQPGCFGGVCSGGKSYFAVTVPPESFGTPKVSKRSVVFLLDRSGSMAGVSLDQAKKAVRACLGALSEQDQFAIVAFDDHCATLADGGSNPRLLPADSEARAQADGFLDGIHARGGTELGPAIREAAGLLEDGSGDLFVVTDGQVAAGEDILGLVRRLRVRLHCLGIGAASQDRFLTLLARETGGVSRFATARERIDVQAIELFASSGAPCATGVRAEIEGLTRAQLTVPPAERVFESSPLLVFGEAQGSGRGQLRLRWGDGRPRAQLTVPLVLRPHRDAEILRDLQGARLITDLESELQGEPAPALIPSRNNRRILAKLEELGRRYGLANRAMALVAVVERPGDNPDLLPKTEVVPVGMPEDTAFAAYFRRRAQSSPNTMTGLFRRSLHSSSAFQSLSTGTCHRPFYKRYPVAPGGPADNSPPPPVSGSGQFLGLTDAAHDPALPWSTRPHDLLVIHAARLAPDGGLPGDTEDERLFHNAALLLCFLSAGNTLHTGPFRIHVHRLVDFLETRLDRLADPDRRQFVEELIARARTDRSLPPEPWFQAGTDFVQCSLVNRPGAWTDFIAQKLPESV